MTLDSSTAPCQGRTVHAMGSATLAEECTDCARRIHIEPGADYIWINPPAYVKTWLGGFCSGRIEAAQEAEGVTI